MYHVVSRPPCVRGQIVNDYNGKRLLRDDTRERLMNTKEHVISVMQTAWQEGWTRLRHPVFGMSMVVLPVVLAVIGPFRSDVYTFWQAVVLWALILWGCTIPAMFTRALVDASLTNVSFLKQGAISAAVFAGYATPLLHLILVDWQGMEPTLYPSWPKVALTCFISSFGVAGVRYVLFVQNMTPAASKAEGAALLDRLEISDPAQIIRMTVDDHYVEVHTDQGVERLLMRFADALRESGGLPGLCVHRSHWVHSSAVLGCRKDGARVFLTTRDGAEVPVSKTYRAEVENMGWLDV